MRAFMCCKWASNCQVSMMSLKAAWRKKGTWVVQCTFFMKGPCRIWPASPWCCNVRPGCNQVQCQTRDMLGAFHLSIMYGEGECHRRMLKWLLKKIVWQNKCKSRIKPSRAPEIFSFGHPTFPHRQWRGHHILSKQDGMGFQARGNRRKTLRGNNKATSINDIVIAIFLAPKERKSSSLPCFNWKRTRIEGCFQRSSLVQQICKVCKRNICDSTAWVEVHTQKLETGLHSQLGSGVASSHVYRTCLKFWPALLGAPWQVLAVLKIFPIHFSQETPKSCAWWVSCGPDRNSSKES